MCQGVSSSENKQSSARQTLCQNPYVKLTKGRQNTAKNSFSAGSSINTVSVFRSSWARSATASGPGSGSSPPIQVAPLPNIDHSLPDGFWITFIGQAIVGASQMFTLGIPPRLAAVWFGPDEVSKACALGVFGNQVSPPPGWPSSRFSWESPSALLLRH